jgi:hypothetical protein
MTRQGYPFYSYLENTDLHRNHFANAPDKMQLLTWYLEIILPEKYHPKPAYRMLLYPQAHSTHNCFHI